MQKFRTQMRNDALKNRVNIYITGMGLIRLFKNAFCEYLWSPWHNILTYRLLNFHIFTNSMFSLFQLQIFSWIIVVECVIKCLHIHFCYTMYTLKNCDRCANANNGGMQSITVKWCASAANVQKWSNKQFYLFKSNLQPFFY